MNIDYTSALAPLCLPIGWDADCNIFGRENLTPEQNAAIDAAIAAYDPLPELISSKLAAIQAEKCRIRDAGFVVSGIHYDSDQSARTAYLELALEIAADPAYSTNWKASEGVWVTMDAAVFAQVKLAGTGHVSACFAWQASRDAELAVIQAAVAAGTMSGEEAIAAVEAVSVQFAV